MALSAGDRLGRYEILGPIGAGGMGEVYRARDTDLDREVAVKVLPESFAADTIRLERFQREAKALAALFVALAAVFAGGCESPDDSNGIDFNAIQLPTDLVLNLACADAGVGLASLDEINRNPHR